MLSIRGEHEPFYTYSHIHTTLECSYVYTNTSVVIFPVIELIT